MGDVGVFWEFCPLGHNAVVERFYRSLKDDWIFKVHQPTRSHMKGDVAGSMKYYNSDRLYSANDSMSLIDYENSLKEVSGFS